MGVTAADPTYVGKVHGENGGDDLVVESGGSIDVLAGGALKFGGVDQATALAKAVAGVVAGGRVAAGVVTLDGSNPTPIATGLTTVTSCVATLVSTAAPGLDPTVVTVDFANALGNALAAGLVNLQAWKATSNANPTLVASTNNTAQVAWMAFGT